MNEKIPRVSVIIPSYDGDRCGNVPKLLEDLKKQTFQDFEVIIVQGIKPNGRARNEGVKKAKGEIFVFIDDDVRLGNEKIIENFFNVLNKSKEIGLVGASRFLPENANYFQKISAKQIPRSYFPEVYKITESDMATHDCLAIKKKVYEEVGGESNYLVRGTDPDLRYRLREKGYKIVIAPETIIYHPMPESLKELIKKSFKNGIGSAWVFKNYPDKVYEAPDGRIKNFKGTRSFIYRWSRRIFDLLFSLITLKFIRFIYDLFYIIGYIFGLFLKNEKIEKMIF